VADYFSRPVLLGYLHGVVVVLIVGQLSRLTGASLPATRAGSQVVELVDRAGTSNGVTVVVGLASLAVLFAMRWKLPRAPAALVVVVGAIAASGALDLQGRGVAVVGPVPRGLPQLSWPGFRAGELVHLLPAALGIFAVSLPDVILTARAYAGRHHEHVRANQEVLALGVASLAASVSSGMPVGPSGTRTAVADQMGARTQVASVVSAASVLAVLLCLTGPLSLLPSAALGAVIVYVAASLVDLGAWRRLAAESRGEVVIAAIAMAGVVVVGILPALLIAVAVSILDVVARSAKPHDAVLGYVPRLGRWADVSLHRSAETVPGIVVYRLDDRLFFANVDYVQGRIREAIIGARSPVSWLVFNAEAVPGIDATGIEAFRQLDRELARGQTCLVVARAHSPVVSRLFELPGAVLAPDRLFPTVERAVAVCRVTPGPGARPAGGPGGDPETVDHGRDRYEEPS
jgi:SulP family sulfate permease